jgi:hypothetical protein
MATGHFDHLGKLRISFAASTDVTRIDAVLGERLGAGPLKVAGCGYGVGLSWGAFAGELSSVSVAPILPFPR